MSSSAARVVNLEKYREQQFLASATDHELLLEILNKLPETTNDSRVEQLEAENMRLQSKLQNCIPVGSIVFLTSFASVMVACAVIYILQLIFDSKVVDFYILTFVFFAALILLCTTIKSVQEWRKFLSNGD